MQSQWENYVLQISYYVYCLPFQERKLLEKKKANLERKKSQEQRLAEQEREKALQNSQIKAKQEQDLRRAEKLKEVKEKEDAKVRIQSKPFLVVFPYTWKKACQGVMLFFLPAKENEVILRQEKARGKASSDPQAVWVSACACMLSLETHFLCKN